MITSVPRNLTGSRRLTDYEPPKHFTHHVPEVRKVLLVLERRQSFTAEHRIELSLYPLLDLGMKYHG